MLRRIGSLTSSLIPSGSASSSPNSAARGSPQLQRSRTANELGGPGALGDGAPPPLPDRLARDSMLGPRQTISWLSGKGPAADVPGRPISTVATPTVTDSKGRVRDPGHVQLQSSPEEQAQYGVGPVLGHSPQIGMRPGSRKVEHETGTFPNGQPFDIKAVRSPALPAGQDKVMKDASIRHDHGHMTPEQAERFKSYEGQPASPEYQTVRDNCVTGYDQMFSGVMGRSPQNPPVGTRPQDIADANRNVRTDGSDLERK